MISKNHYQKAADEIIYAIKEVFAISGSENPLKHTDLRKGRRTIMKMLKENFIPRKSEYK